MPKRKVFESQTIDLETGEIKSVTTKFVSTNNENFFMSRTTEGLQWITLFNNLTEIQLMMIMIELENPKNNYIVAFTGLQVKESALFLKVSEISIRKCLTKLCESNFLKKICNANYLINPATFYKGGSYSIKQRIQNYNDYDKRKVS